MGEQRQLFRFRLPWLSAATTPRPAAEPQPRPAAQTQAPSQPTTTIPIQRPPFRPAGIAPVQTTPTQTQLRKTEPQPAAPSRAATDLKSTTQPASPPRLTNQIRAASVPSSPSRRATQVQTLSPPKKSPTSTSTQPPSTASQETTFQSFGVAVKPSEASAQGKEVASSTVAAKETPSAPVKPKEREQRKKVAEERMKAATKGSTHEEPEQRTITKLLATATEAGTKARELLGASLETGKRYQQKQEDIERKKTWTTSSIDEKQIKTVSSTYPKDGSTPNNSHQNHVTSNWEQVPLHKEIREDISKFVHKMATGQPKLPTDEKSISVLTLAGENRGASFHLGSESTKKDGLVHIHRGYKINPDDSPDATTDGEGSSRGRKPKASMTKENPAPRAYVNSNTQSINNSIVFESSVNERNPGVHLEFLHNLAESTKSSAKAEPIETRKAESNITPAEKLTYEPTVRRRCLRGLFAEPSDSDPDNPEKPRRHGCRYSCGQKNKEKERGIL